MGILMLQYTIIHDAFPFIACSTTSAFLIYSLKILVLQRDIFTFLCSVSFVLARSCSYMPAGLRSLQCLTVSRSFGMIVDSSVCLLHHASASLSFSFTFHLAFRSTARTFMSLFDICLDLDRYCTPAVTPSAFESCSSQHQQCESLLDHGKYCLTSFALSWSFNCPLQHWPSLCLGQIAFKHSYHNHTVDSLVV